MPADLLRRSWYLAALALLGAAVPLALGPRATLPPADYFLHDQQRYLAMAESPASFAPEPNAAPFCWRLLPSAAVRASGLPPRRGFHLLTIGTLALIPPVIALMLSAAGISAGSSIALSAVAALAPAVAGYLSWDFIRPDGPSLLLVVVAAWAAIRGRPAVFILTLVALSLTKETWLVAAAFALLWSRACQPVFWKWAVIGTGLAAVVAAGVRIAIPAAQAYSFVTIARDLYWPLDLTTIARRILLATSATWNILTPIVAFALASRWREPRAWALLVPILIASAQILVAIDTQRLVAAAYPFVLLAAAWELDRIAASRRAAIGVAIGLAQLPWLVTYARVWPLPLRAVEILLAIVTVTAVIHGVRVARAFRLRPHAT